jgi:hypothetical protein
MLGAPRGNRRARDTWGIDVDHQQIALVIRWLHVAAMAAIFGGALLVAWLAARGPRSIVVQVAVRYEQIFWAGLGTLVMTGVGNLGAFGLALPAPLTDWGTTFIAKMTAVLLLIALSLTRSIVVARLASSPDATVSALRGLYVSTAAGIAGIAALAVWLAHG